MVKDNSNKPVIRKRFRDTVKEKRIFEHITIKTDLITDEDIRNVITDYSMINWIYTVDEEYPGKLLDDTSN